MIDLLDMPGPHRIEGFALAQWSWDFVHFVDPLPQARQAAILTFRYALTLDYLHVSETDVYSTVWSWCSAQLYESIQQMRMHTADL